MAKSAKTKKARQKKPTLKKKASAKKVARKRSRPKTSTLRPSVAKKTAAKSARRRNAASEAARGPDKSVITPTLVAAHGLKPDEYVRLTKLIGREPSVTELGIFSAMWNEHCSYKSSKIH